MEAGKTTTFVEDGLVSTETFSAPRHGHDLDTGGKGIPDFFGKPHLVYSGAWTTADTQGQAVLPIVPGISIDSLLTTNPVWVNKWAGFSMVRADAVVRLQINATPFHQGKLLMHFLPCTLSMGFMGGSYEAMHNLNITTKMMQPSVELDCLETACLMTIPYITPANYFVLGGAGSSAYPQYGRGSLQVSVLAPLKTGPTAQTSIDYSIYVHFENVELVGPLVPQSATGGKGKFKTKKLGKSAPELELAAMKAGPISGALSTAGTIARALGAVPGLSAITTPASWVLDGMSGLASFFGYSKPLLNQAPMLTARQFQRYAATCDGTDSSYPLAIRSDNFVTLTDAKTVYSGDEMSWSFLRGVSTIVNTVTWSDAQNEGAVVFTKQLSPSTLFSTTSVTRSGSTAVARTGPPIWYLSHLFKQYRGSIRMHMKIVKTNFHSGRLQITFTPKPAAGVTPTLATGQYAIRELLDVRSGDSIEMVFPYLLPTDYISLSDSIGTLDVIVLNALRMPNTTSPTVDILFYFSGGDDLEYAVPGYRPGVSNYPPFSPQMDAGPTKLSSGTPGMVHEGPMSTMGAEHCVGEMFSSVRQLLARYNQIWIRTTHSGTGFSLWPFFTAVTKLTSTGLVGPQAGGDLFSFISPMYVFYRGGMRVGVQTTAHTGPYLATLDSSQVQQGGSVLGVPSLVNGNTGTIDYLGFPNTTAPNGTVATDAGLGLASFTVPYYCRMPVSLNYPNPEVTVPVVSGTLETSQATTVVAVKGGDNTKTTIYRSIAEDFQFQYFVGCPPLVVSAPTLPSITPSPVFLKRDDGEEKTGMRVGLPEVTRTASSALEMKKQTSAVTLAKSG